MKTGIGRRNAIMIGLGILLAVVIGVVTWLTTDSFLLVLPLLVVLPGLSFGFGRSRKDH